jgi:hypothetical protein
MQIAADLETVATEAGLAPEAVLVYAAWIAPGGGAGGPVRVLARHWVGADAGTLVPYFHPDSDRFIVPIDINPETQAEEVQLGEHTVLRADIDGIPRYTVLFAGDAVIELEPMEEGRTPDEAMIRAFFENLDLSDL